MCGALVACVRVCVCVCSGQLVKLSPATEEIATFYAKMLDHEYTSKEVFQNNFFSDWKEVRIASAIRELLNIISSILFVDFLFPP